MGSDIDVVLARKGELAILAHPEHGQAGRQVYHLAVFPPRAGRKRTGDQNAGAGIETEGARMRGANVGMLNGGWLAGLLVDGKHRDVAFAGAEHPLAVPVFHAGPRSARQARAIAPINTAAVAL